MQKVSHSTRVSSQTNSRSRVTKSEEIRLKYSRNIRMPGIERAKFFALWVWENARKLHTTGKSSASSRQKERAAKRSETWKHLILARPDSLRWLTRVSCAHLKAGKTLRDEFHHRLATFVYSRWLCSFARRIFIFHFMLAEYSWTQNEFILSLPLACLKICKENEDGCGCWRMKIALVEIVRKWYMTTCVAPMILTLHFSHTILVIKLQQRFWCSMNVKWSEVKNGEGLIEKKDPIPYSLRRIIPAATFHFTFFALIGSSFFLSEWRDQAAAWGVDT